MSTLKVKSVQVPQRISSTEEKMRVQVFSLKLEAKDAPEFIDITDHVKNCLAQAGVKNGTLTVFSRHTTAAIRLNENEPLLIEDMKRFLERMAPRNGDYKHNDFTIRTVNMTDDECPNGHAHCQQLLLSTSETIPIIDGAMQIGRWQRVFMVELDRPRPREVLVQVIGG